MKSQREANAKLDSIKISYSAAQIFPAKLLLHQRLIQSARKQQRILPLHIQLNPTNRCMFDCEFCSCSGREKSLELKLDDIKNVMSEAKECGCESVTITGGGEPLMHREIKGIIQILVELGIEIGVVTNGVLLNRLSEETLENVVWIRISSSDNLGEQLASIKKSVDDWFEGIERAVQKGNNIDWAFSHVVLPYKAGSLEYLKDLLFFANDHKFTHIRIVNDILNAEKLEDRMKVLQEALHKVADDSIVNYQDRALWTHGSSQCYISLLKPVIGADGFIYPCCGTQYALENPSRDYEKTMRMGRTEDLGRIFKEQQFFDGSVCSKCYYSNYNWALGVLLSEVKHQKFV